MSDPDQEKRNEWELNSDIYNLHLPEIDNFYDEKESANLLLKAKVYTITIVSTAFIWFSSYDTEVTIAAFLLCIGGGAYIDYQLKLATKAEKQRLIARFKS